MINMYRSNRIRSRRELPYIMSDLVVQVSENDEVLGRVSRKIAHSEARILHREVDIFVINEYGILLDKRVEPPKWCQFGGHPEYYEDRGVAEDRKVRPPHGAGRGSAFGPARGYKGFRHRA